MNLRERLESLLEEHKEARDLTIPGSYHHKRHVAAVETIAEALAHPERLQEDQQ